MTEQPKSDSDKIKELEWALDQEQYAHRCLRTRLDVMIKRLERKRILTSACFDHNVGDLGNCRADHALCLGQTQAYRDTIDELKEAINVK